MTTPQYNPSEESMKQMADYLEASKKRVYEKASSPGYKSNSNKIVTEKIVNWFHEQGVPVRDDIQKVYDEICK